MFNRIPLVLALAAGIASAQRAVEFESRPAVVLENDRIELTILPHGVTFASLILKDDGARQSPFWNPAATARAGNRRPPVGSGFGHFLCLDGFGSPSREERAAGLPGHGEAKDQDWKTVGSAKQGNISEIRFQTSLPNLQEDLSRRIRLADGENVISVETELTSLTAFDRPISWGEHATIGTPYLAPNVTVVDIAPGPCQVRPATGQMRTLAGGRDFTYPMAPLIAGGTKDLRAAPGGAATLDHITCAVATDRPYGFVTSLRLDKHLVLGYLFRREDYPWLQQWLSYPSETDMARGTEFSTQPYDLPRREVVEMGKLLGVPTYRWLPAKSKITTHFLFFYAHVPDGFTKVDEVSWKDGKITVEDRKSNKTVTLTASIAP